MMEDADRSLEIVILLILGMFMFLFGLLLFNMLAGRLPYNPHSTYYGLFLFIVSFQVITLGKTPLGDFRRSGALIVLGICAAIFGIAACFLPKYLTEFARVFTGIILLASGFYHLLELFFSERRARMWIRIGGILQHLTIACGLVYALSFIAGLITLIPGITTDMQTAFILIAYGVSLFYLVWCLRGVAKTYPPEPPPYGFNTEPKGRFGLFSEASLPLSQAIMVLMGISLIFLGVLLFPISFGLLAFSPDGQFGLLLTVMAIQTMALGDTPLGQFKRSAFIMSIGLAFAALGIVSSIVPGLLTGVIQTLLGLLNVVAGTLSLGRRYLPRLLGIGSPPVAPVAVPPEVETLMSTQTTLSWLTMGFGAATLFPGLIPGLLMPGILVVYGLILFKLVVTLRKLTAIQPTPA